MFLPSDGEPWEPHLWDLSLYSDSSNSPNSPYRDGSGHTRGTRRHRGSFLWGARCGAAKCRKRLAIASNGSRPDGIGIKIKPRLNQRSNHVIKFGLRIPPCEPAPKVANLIVRAEAGG